MEPALRNESLFIRFGLRAQEKPRCRAESATGLCSARACGVRRQGSDSVDEKPVPWKAALASELAQTVPGSTSAEAIK